MKSEQGNLGMETTQNVDLDKLFGIEVQYKVPLYQRRYVWDESNWEALWRDILAQLGLELVEDPKSSYHDKHFTGVIVTDPIQESESLERFEVIDGQQRLTTFQIILCVIRDIFQSKECFDQAADANALIANKPAVAKRYSDATYKFVLTEFDEKEFEVVAKGDYGLLIPDAFDEESNSLNGDKLRHVRSAVFPDRKSLSVNVLKAYNHFYEWIRIYMKKDFDYKN